MPFNFSDLKALVYAQCGYGQGGTTVAPDVAARVAANLNEGTRNILRDPELGPELRHMTLTISSVINKKLYPIPNVFSRINSIVQETNDRRLGLMTFQRFRQIDPGERATGMPYSYIEWGRAVAFAQPATTGTGLWVASSAAGDTTQTVDVQGVRLNGDPDIPRTAALNGVTRVAVGALTDYVGVIQFTVRTTIAGAVSLYDAAAAGNELARIPAGHKSVFGLLIRLFPTPSAALDYVVDGQINIQPMVQDTDIPALPEDFQDIPYLFAKMREYERTNVQLWKIAKDEYEEKRNDLRVYIQFPDDYRPVAGQRSTIARVSTLGAWFEPNNNWP